MVRISTSRGPRLASPSPIRFGLAQWALAACALLLAGILAPSARAQGPLTVLVHDSFAIDEAVLEQFTQHTGIEVEILPAGDAGAVVNRAILTRDNPIGDVLYGVDDSLLARALEAELFEPYRSPELDRVPARFRFDPEHRVTPVDVGYVNFNWDVAWFEQAEVDPPADIVDLAEPAYRGLTAVTDPTSSSPGLAFMLATIARFGEDGAGDWLDFWADLRDNDLLVTQGWNDAYYGAFTRYGGDRPIVLSYATSPAAEVMFADEPLEEAPTANLFCRACVWQQIEGVGILAGTDRVGDAQAFIDFMLSTDFQQAIPPNMFVYPVIEEAAVPPEFEAFAAVPTEDEIATLDRERQAERQALWLEQWTQVVQQGRDPAQVRSSP